MATSSARPPFLKGPQMNDPESIESILGIEPEPPRAKRGKASDDTSGDIWNWKPAPDWRPDPRYVKAEPDYSKGFRVGTWYEDPRGEAIAGPKRRQALPLPNYRGKPGDLITDEMERAYWNRWNIWLRASMSLEQCIRLHLTMHQENSGRPDKTELQEMFAQEWQWLKGLWNASGLSEPPTEQLDAWANELQARYEAQRKASSGLK